MWTLRGQVCYVVSPSSAKEETAVCVSEMIKHSQACRQRAPGWDTASFRPLMLPQSLLCTTGYWAAILTFLWLITATKDVRVRSVSPCVWYEKRLSRGFGSWEMTASCFSCLADVQLWDYKDPLKQHCQKDVSSVQGIQYVGPQSDS